MSCCLKKKRCSCSAVCGTLARLRCARYGFLWMVGCLRLPGSLQMPQHSTDLCPLTMCAVRLTMDGWLSTVTGLSTNASALYRSLPAYDVRGTVNYGWLVVYGYRALYKCLSTLPISARLRCARYGYLAVRL